MIVIVAKAVVAAEVTQDCTLPAIFYKNFAQSLGFETAFQLDNRRWSLDLDRIA
jgi:hypothetical protein